MQRHGYPVIAAVAASLSFLFLTPQGISFATAAVPVFVGMRPETWIAGPDLAVLDARFGWSGPPRSLPIADWNALPDLSGSLLSCDSLTLRPRERPEHRTFFEIYGDRLYVHTEGDTVHMNSWVIAHGGGFDADSPYLPVLGASPALNDTAACVAAGTPWVVRPDGLVGSPIGHHSWLETLLEPTTILAVAAQSLMFPDFDPSSVLYRPNVGDYQAPPLAGKAYLLLRAEDSDGLRDDRIDDPHALVEAVDGGTGTPEQVALRPRILTFYVDKAPFLRIDDPGFVPQPGHAFASRMLDLHLLAGDLDPYDRSGGPPPPGGPTPTGVLRWNVALRGRNADGRDTTIAALPGPVFTPDITIEVPDAIVGPDVTIRVQLCDCADCENAPGSGRCVATEIPVTVGGVTATLASLRSTTATPDRVVLEWQVEVPGRVQVERREPGTAWALQGEIAPDGTGRAGFEDVAVVAGARYGYRLALGGEPPTHAGEAWVDVPSRAAFALEGIEPNPSEGRLGLIRISLAGTGGARCELLDVSGRRLAARELDALGPGRHEIRLDPEAGLPAGVYLLRLIEGGKTRTARAAVMR
jgi:hypothetical protein